VLSDRASLAFTRFLAKLQQAIVAIFGTQRERTVLAGLLVLGAAIRCFVALGPIDELHPDEIFQYLEQGHRLAFKRGVVPWEYIVGIRSWFLPFLVAGVMKATSWFSSNPLIYVYLLRCIAAAFSLVPIYYGFRIVLPKAGLIWAAIAGLLCATWYHAVFLSPSLLTEVLAAYLMFPPVFLASDRANEGKHRTIVIGLLLGLAFSLRFQMAPALLAIAWWHCGTDYQNRWPRLLLGAGAVVCTVSGLLDWVTLGSPFQSIWLNFDLNALKGVSASFGRSGWFAYVDAIAGNGSIQILLLVWLAIVGAYRAPLLSITALTILVSHSFFGHKEYRFIVFVMLSLPIFIALGAAALTDRLRIRVSPMTSWIVPLVIAAGVPTISYGAWQSIRREESVHNEGVINAFSAAHEQAKLCAVGVSDVPWFLTGGYTYFDRDAPIYYSELLTPSKNRIYSVGDLGWGRARIPMQMDVVLEGQTIVQLPRDSLFKNTNAFNYLVAAQGRRVPGYSTVHCFANGRGLLWPGTCLLRRPGGCTEP
jgi:hypothetical protein